MTLPVRRLAAALVLGAALVTSGCGNTQANRAAVVDGSVITETDLQEAMSQLNSMQPQQPFTPDSTLTALVRAPALIDYLGQKGFVGSESEARQLARNAGVVDPADSTLQILRSDSAVKQASESGQLGQAETTEVIDLIRGQEIVINPRYGTFDPDTVAVGAATPVWVQQANSQ